MDWSGPVTQVRAGVGGAPIWIELPSMRAGSVLELTQSVDAGRLFEELADGTWRDSRIGDSVTTSGRGMSIAPMAFVLSEDVRADARRYLRITQPNTSAVGLKVWEFQVFRSDLERRRMVQSLLLGFVAAIILYNLVVAAITREAVFGLNAAAISCIVIVDLYLNGIGPQWIWPKAFSNVIVNFGLAATCAIGALFIDRFLRTGRSNQKIAQPFKSLAITACILALAQLILSYWVVQPLLLLLIVALLISALSITVRKALRGDARAKILLIPLGFVMVPGSFVVLAGTLFGSAFVPFRAHILEITLASEALAFSLALAALIRVHATEASSAKAELLNAELQAAETFASIQDRERARIATDLHDSIGHNLVIASSLLDTDRGLEKNAEAAKLIRATLSNVRRISHELHPSALQHLGWRGAVSALFASMEEVYHIETHLRQSGNADLLSKAAQTHLFRILQEAISNIVRHSKATRCDAEILIGAAKATLVIQDNGKGLPDGAAAPRGLGLISIGERVRALGGEWRFTSSDNSGVKIEVSVPIRQAETQV